MRALVVIPIALCALTACELRKPFEATVVAAGVDGSKVRAAIFDERAVYAQHPADGTDLSVRLDIDDANAGRAFFTADFPPEGVEQPTEFAFTPLSAPTAPLGKATFSLLDPPPETEKQLKIVAWVDADDDGLLDLSQTGDSEFARTIYLFNKDENSKAYLKFYNYVPKGNDPFYTATALTCPSCNLIVTEDILKGWMAVLTQETEPPPAPPEGA
jgi:hypothetical protein